MKRPFTVYFDTNFFIWLGKAPEPTANALVDKLNALGVRHVLSDMLVQELLSSVHRAQYDEALVKRAQRFELEPYRTNDFLTWEVLLSAGTVRKAVANAFVQIDDMLTAANSHSIMANRIDRGRVTPEQFSELSNATTPFLEAIGF